MKRTPLILLLVAVLLFCTCGDRTVQRMLDRAETVMNENPSEAIAVLDSIGDDGLSRSQHMRLLLLLTNAQNKCDTVFRSDSIQRLLVDYYESHGTANERMLAHYLLGRAYYDMGEMPMALNAYQLALADTSGTEKDYYQIVRIYAQMAKIYYHQYLLQEQIDCINQSVKFALLAKDTIGAVNNYLQKANSYDLMGKSDSVITICENVNSFFKGKGMYKQSAQDQGLLALHYIKKGMLEKAKHCLDVYEAESGFFDSNHNIEPHRTIYYSMLGEYYTTIKSMILQKSVSAKNFAKAKTSTTRMLLLGDLHSYFRKRTSLTLQPNTPYTVTR